MASSQDERATKFQEMSKERMGETNVKYCSHLCKKLGRGMSATVYPGYHFGIWKPTAVKFIEKEYVRQTTNEDEQMKELIIWTRIDQNINIIRLYDSYNDPEYGMFLAMELAERTFKSQILKYNQTEDEIAKWLYQITCAVEYLHGKGVIHRDIKPDNILMTLQDGDRLIAKLADFGVSKMLSSAEITSTFSNANGTLLWMAPEALENHQHGKFKNTRMLDIYALGMTMYFGLSKGGHPFAHFENEDVINKIVPRMTKKDAKPILLRRLTVAANDLFQKMMQREPENRPEILEVKEHCLFWDWKKRQQFLIRTAICLSRQGCPEIDSIKNEIDDDYKFHYKMPFEDTAFNWIEIAKDKKFAMEELLFTSLTRKKPTTEYGDGESVTKFMKLFRDKYVHYPDMKTEAADKFSENDRSFCEEKYVTFLTSICPGLLAILYGNLQRYASVQNMIPLSKLYFPWKLGKDTESKSQPQKALATIRDILEERNQIKRDILEAIQDDLPIIEGFKKYRKNLSESVSEVTSMDATATVLEENMQLKPKQTTKPVMETGKNESTIGKPLTRNEEDFNSEAIRRLRIAQEREFTLGNF